MARAKVVRIDGEFFLKLTAEQAAGLGLDEGREVEVELRRDESGATVAEIWRDLRGKYKGAFADGDTSDMWDE